MTAWGCETGKGGVMLEVVDIVLDIQVVVFTESVIDSTRVWNLEGLESCIGATDSGVHLVAWAESFDSFGRDAVSLSRSEDVLCAGMASGVNVMPFGLAGGRSDLACGVESTRMGTGGVFLGMFPKEETMTGVLGTRLSATDVGEELLSMERECPTESNEGLCGEMRVGGLSAPISEAISPVLVTDRARDAEWKRRVVLGEVERKLWSLPWLFRRDSRPSSFFSTWLMALVPDSS